MNTETQQRIPAPNYILHRDPKFIHLRNSVFMASGIWLLVSLVGVILLKDIFLVISLGGFTILIIWLILEVYHRIQIETIDHYYQLEALLYINQILDLRLPLPPMRFWAMSPDAGTHYITQILEHKPQLIVELGSGISTLLSAYSVSQKDIDSQIIAIEHEDEFAEITRNNIKLHQMDETATVVNAPLKPITIDGFAGRWYDTSIFQNIENIDLLFVDGPPGQLQSLSRYPAVPILFDKLSDNAIIVVDDYARKDEITIVNHWVNEYALEVISIIPNEKGMLILRKTQS